VVLVDKPAGPTSHDVVARVRRVAAERSAGHTGTLDPFASGLLVVLVGRATRLARFAPQEPKVYRATMRLGQATTTDDATGEPCGEPAGAAVVEAVDDAKLAAAMERMLGTHPQRPPGFSAKKVDGVRSYRRARKGETVTLPAVPVTIYSLDLLERRGHEVDFRAAVGSGTYVRAIARDLGETLGCGAHLTALRREAIGPLTVDGAVTLAALSADDVRPAHTVLGHLPHLQLEPGEREAVGHGRPIRRPGTDGTVILRDGESVAAVAEAGEDGWLRPVVVLVPA
jgi:tRNA pseudouridine55 synthase